jgi:hypothetical protein
MHKANSVTISRVERGPAGRSIDPGADGFQMWKCVTDDDITSVGFKQYECLHSMEG